MEARTSAARRTPFDVRRQGIPIQDSPLKGAVDPHISYTDTFGQFTSLIDAGATVNELYQWYRGEYPPAFLAYVQVGVRNRHLIRTHSEAAAAAKAKK